MSQSQKNTQPCGGPDNDANGCGTVFPRMQTNAILCQLCKKLNKDGISDAEIRTIKERFKQCLQCGLSGSNVSDPCGTCKRQAHQEVGIIDEHTALEQTRRRELMEGRLNRQLGPATPAIELESLRGQNISAPTFAVSYECRRSNAPNTVDRILGKCCQPFAESMTLLELKEYIVRSVNPRWIESHSADLQPAETELRICRNLALPLGDETLTLRQFYNKYNLHGLRDIYLVPPPGMSKGNRGSAFSVELFIHINRFIQRTGEGEELEMSVLDSISNGKRKRQLSTSRRGTQTPASGRGGRNKRFCSDRGNFAPLTSTFERDRGSESASMAQSQQSENPKELIKFRRLSCEINEDNGTPSILEASTTEYGYIDLKPMILSSSDRGKTKDIYAFAINDKLYVAKKLINIGKGQGIDITLKNSLEYLKNDLIRLKRMDYFATLFDKQAQNKGAEIAAFQVSDGFIIKVLDDYQEQDNHTSEEVEANNDDNELERPVHLAIHDNELHNISAIYLIEPRRLSSAVSKYSGTLGMRNRSDKLGATIMAFSHFVIQSSACEYMFADIQGSLDRDPNDNNKTIMTLFDPMTHTPLGKSGLGDHGLTGFRDFIDQHKCSIICHHLSLCSLDAINAHLESIDLNVSD